MNILPPTSETELLSRAYALAGKTLSDIAKHNHKQVPTTLIHAKGWIGQLIEKTLGANGSNLDQPDFINLGIELKTLPVTNQGYPCESTFICKASIPCIESKWESSRVWRKMAKILWIPIESNSEKPIMSLRIGTPILWSPSQTVQMQLKQDWEELTELMILGRFGELSALKGHYLQLRPKAANAKTFIQVIDHQGQPISIVPKGFYIRTLLTRQIIEHHYCT